MYKVPSSDEMTGDGRGQCVRNSRQGKKSKLSSPKQVPVRRWDQQLNRDEDVDKKKLWRRLSLYLGFGFLGPGGWWGRCDAADQEGGKKREE